jgi:TrmH family RNA methyltransferase
MALQPIGLQHPVLRDVLTLRKNEGRTSPDRIVVEGAWEHEQLLTSNAVVESFFWCPEASQTDRAQRFAVEARSSALASYRISERALARLTRQGRPDGLVSVARLPTWSPSEFRFGRSGLVLVADGVEYAGNLGTLIRTVDAAHADCLVLTNRRARRSHPKVLSASRGMVLRTPVLEFDSVTLAAAWLREHGFRVLLADPGTSIGYRSVDYASAPTAIVVGSEGSGLPPEWRSQGFEAVSIPMLGSADSLNVALSAGILLFEARAHKNGW